MDIILSTGDLEQEYEVIDVIFAYDANKEGFLSSASPDKAFEGVKTHLRERCEVLGGDAVINCQFEYRNAIANGIISNKQVIEIFAYGTVVRFK